MLWLAFFASFAVKMPMWPVHTWLPDAHVQAPTAGSVILAGVLLKLGGYGFLRFSLPMFPEASAQLTWLVFGLSAVAVIYTSLVALVQSDMKKLIAYSSVAHMAIVTIGLFAFNRQGIEGAMIVMLSHGLVSGALFLCVGVIYDRLHTREIARYGGLATIMPRYAMLFMLFTMASVGLPGTSGFVGEFLACGRLSGVDLDRAALHDRHHPGRGVHALSLSPGRVRGRAQRTKCARCPTCRRANMRCSRRSRRWCCGWASIPKASWRRCARTSACWWRAIERAKPAGDSLPTAGKPARQRRRRRPCGGALMNYAAQIAMTLPEVVLGLGAIALMLVAAWGGQRRPARVVDSGRGAGGRRYRADRPGVDGRRGVRTACTAPTRSPLSPRC